MKAEIWTVNIFRKISSTKIHTFDFYKKLKNISLNFSLNIYEYLLNQRKIKIAQSCKSEKITEFDYLTSDTAICVNSGWIIYIYIDALVDDFLKSIFH